METTQPVGAHDDQIRLDGCGRTDDRLGRAAALDQGARLRSCQWHTPEVPPAPVAHADASVRQGRLRDHWERQPTCDPVDHGAQGGSAAIARHVPAAEIASVRRGAFPDVNHRGGQRPFGNSKHLHQEDATLPDCARHRAPESKALKADVLQLEWFLTGGKANLNASRDVQPRRSSAAGARFRRHRRRVKRRGSHSHDQTSAERRAALRCLKVWQDPCPFDRGLLQI